MSRAPSFSRGRARALLAASVAFAIAVPGLAALEGRGSAFAVEEEAEGIVLACAIYPESDLVLRLEPKRIGKAERRIEPDRPVEAGLSAF